MYTEEFKKIVNEGFDEFIKLAMEKAHKNPSLNFEQIVQILDITIRNTNNEVVVQEMKNQKSATPIK